MKGFFQSSRIQRENPVAGLIPKCGSCQLYKSCQSPKMKIHGDGARGVLVIGEAPGKMEDEIGRPFVGVSGKFLRETLKEFGINLDRDAWTTNSLICHPEKNKTPDDKQISYCRPNILNAIRLYEPRVIVTFGRSALVSVLGGYWQDVKAMERWTGWRIPLKKHWVCPTWHPAYLLRMKNSLMDRLFATHLRKAFGIKKEPNPVECDSKIEVIFDDMAAHKAIREIDEQGGWVAVDYEGNCLKPEYPKARIASCAISNGERTISFPWAGHSITATGMLLKSDRTKKIASNLKFEERWTLKNFGFGVTNWGWDTMLASHCLDNRQGITSLKFQSLVKLGVPSYNDHIAPYLQSKGDSPYNRIDDIDMKDLLYYGGQDAFYEHCLAMIQRKELGY